MSVLKGEGKVPILFGMKSVTAGALTHETYLARPDLAGEWPTILIVPSAWGVTSAVKDVARRLARQGVAAVVIDLYRGGQPARNVDRESAAAALATVPQGRAMADIADVVRYVTNPAGFWSNAEHGLAILGIGAGGPFAIATAGDVDAALALAGSPLPVAQLASISAPILGLFGRDDDVVSLDEIMEARSAVPHAEWVLYDGVGHDFLDDYLAAFDFEAHQDAVERIAAFCEKLLLPTG
jgi:carboxymethylenebutenolidase